MTGAEMRHYRLRWHWTQTELGTWLGYNVQTISRYERDLDAIPIAVDRLLRYEDLLRHVATVICPVHLGERPYDRYTPL